MKSTHTPGPWISAYSGPIESDGGQNEDTQYANARLIAAAPDMLAALQGLFEHCAMVHKHWGDGDNTKEADKAIETARLVIAKATGEGE